MAVLDTYAGLVHRLQYLSVRLQKRASRRKIEKHPVSQNRETVYSSINYKKDMSTPDGQEDPFTLSGEFEFDEDRDHELGGGNSRTALGDDTPSILTEKEIGKIYYTLEFRQVQTGTFKGEPAWLLVLDARFHTSNSKDVRFKAAEITLDFGGKANASSPGIIKGFAPSMLYGAPIIEQSRWHWEIAASTNINLPPATIELARVAVGHSTEYPIRHMLKLQGSERGVPRRNKVLWSVEERHMDGIPAQLPPLAVIVTHTPGQILQLGVSLKADTGFSMNPKRWPFFLGDKKRVIPLNVQGKRQGATLHDTNLETLDLAIYVKEYLSDSALQPAASAFIS